MQILTETDIFAKLQPRNAATHKGDYGRVSCVCGSLAYRGAATLAVSAALRAGAGIVRLCAGEPIIAACAASVPAATYLPLALTSEGMLAADNVSTVCKTLRAEDICLIGPGVGQSADTRALVEGMVTNAPCPLVLDADALNVLAHRTELFSAAKQTPILTPHMGEFARLCGKSIVEITENAPALVSAFAREHRAVVVLKSHITYIAAPDGRLVKNHTGNAGLAKGGSGDLLSGLIAGFAAQGHAPFDAACIGVYLAGAAADLCAARKSKYAMLPGEQLDDLCTLFLRHGL